MKKLMTLFAGMMLSVMAEAKVLVVSDIDDTLKVAHVLSKKGAATSFLDANSRFVGMAEIFQSLQKQHKDIEFHYVSLAPKFLMVKQHSEFLEDNGFPVTKLHMNPGVKQDPELKQKVIRQLINDKNPEMIIYFGDNGQFDAAVYNQMDKEFPQIASVSYIREAYSKLARAKFPTMEGQIGFVTSVEVAIDLISRNLLSAKSYRQIEDIVYKRILKDDGAEHFGPMVFPWWQDCRDFNWTWDVQNPSKKLQVIKAIVDQRCQ